MLLDDCKELKAVKMESEWQTWLDPHLKEHEKKEIVLPYTDELFQEVSIEWPVTTDQVCYMVLQESNMVILSCSASRLMHLNILHSKKLSMSHLKLQIEYIYQIESKHVVQ